MPIDQKIDYLELPASDFDAIKSFYTRAFGWEFQGYGGDYCAFNDGKLNGGFYRSDQASSTKQGSTLIVLYATSLENTLESVVASGGSIVRPIFSFPGGRRFHFSDPNGNELAVWSDK
jgi:predicted enzyme related to lactoylglutathione lyase